MKKSIIFQHSVQRQINEKRNVPTNIVRRKIGIANVQCILFT